MKTKYYTGFVVIENGKGPIIVAPHATQTYQKATRGDIGSETVALEAVKELGGTAIVATLPRSGDVGLDLNRLPPKSCYVSEKMYEHWKKDDKEYSKYYKTYAWVCRSKQEHNAKMSIYKSFWKAAEKAGKEYKNPFFVFPHTLSARLKNLPTAIDVISKSGEWLDKETLLSLVDKLNRKYKKVIQIRGAHKQDMEGEMLFWLELNDHYIDGVFGGIKKARGISKEWLEEDLTNANDILGSNYKFSQLNSKLYEKLIHRIVKKVNMKITYENIYYGVTAHPVSPLLRKTKGTGVELETMSHLNEMHPEFVVRIIKEISKVAK
ncbi:hypothetical protein CL614_01025 [archaeon]|nr:hypothetical protein [archaeon]|tara:strand:+ start:4230 stop:5195 length:966 start_codon:yes stop_codon:yes gene_type:complete